MTYGAFKASEAFDECLDSVEVEMVGGLVEEEHVGVAVGDFGEGNAALLTTRKLKKSINKK